MSKYVSILIIIPLALTVLGIFSFNWVMYHRYTFQKQVVSSKIEELKSFEFSTSAFNQLRWEEEGKEFEYQGNLYDVASIKFDKGIYTVYCENDWFEDTLIGFLKSPGQKSKNKTPQFQFSEPEISIHLEAGWSFYSIIPERHHSFLLSVILDRNFPPPRFF